MNNEGNMEWEEQFDEMMKRHSWYKTESGRYDDEEYDVTEMRKDIIDFIRQLALSEREAARRSEKITKEI